MASTWKEVSSMRDGFNSNMNASPTFAMAVWHTTPCCPFEIDKEKNKSSRHPFGSSMRATQAGHRNLLLSKADRNMKQSDRKIERPAVEQTTVVARALKEARALDEARTNSEARPEYLGIITLPSPPVKSVTPHSPRNSVLGKTEFSVPPLEPLAFNAPEKSVFLH